MRSLCRQTQDDFHLFPINLFLFFFSTKSNNDEFETLETSLLILSIIVSLLSDDGFEILMLYQSGMLCCAPYVRLQSQHYSGRVSVWRRVAFQNRIDAASRTKWSVCRRSICLFTFCQRAQRNPRDEFNGFSPKRKKSNCWAVIAREPRPVGRRTWFHQIRANHKNVYVCLCLELGC